MYAFIRKGLLLSAVIGTLVMGFASTAAARDPAARRGAVAAGAAAVDSRDDGRWTDDTAAEPADFAADSSGAVGGDASALPGQADGAEDNQRLNDGPPSANPRPPQLPVA